MFRISLPNGSVREMPEGSTPLDVAAAIGPWLAEAAIAATAGGELRDVTRLFEENAAVAWAQQGSPAAIARRRRWRGR